MLKTSGHIDSASESEVFETRWPHRWSLLLAGIVVCVIFVGGLVTTTDAGMAVPDWPGTYGYNMFLYPLESWFFGPWDLFVEHGHRLLGSAAGLVAIFLVISCYLSPAARDVRGWSWVILGLIGSQGLLGGTRVVQDERLVAQIHGCVGPLSLMATVAMVTWTSRWYRETSRAWVGTVATPRRRNLAVTLMGLCFLQLVFGAAIRHIDVSASMTSFKHLVYTHLALALLVVLGTLLYRMLISGGYWKQVGLRQGATILTALVGLQVLLGLSTWVVKYGFPVWFENHAWVVGFVIPEKTMLQTNIVTAHMIVGSLLLVGWTAQVAKFWHLTSGGKRRNFSRQVPVSSPALASVSGVGR